MEISIPEEYYTFTRETSEDDPNLTILGLNKQDMLDSMESSNIYLDAIEPTISSEIIITMVPSDMENYTQLSDSVLLTLATGFETVYQEMGLTYQRSELYEHNQAKFIKIYFYDSTSAPGTYGLQYLTVYGGKTINIILYSYTGSLDSTQETVLANIVDSAHFGTPPPTMAAPEETNAFRFTDSDSGVSFTVPANWTEVPLNEEHNLLDAKFVSNLDAAICIFYSSTDIWEQMDSLENGIYSRAEVNNSFFTKNDIAETLNVPENEVIVTSYGGKEYYQAEMTVTDSSSGITLSMNTVYLIRINNGYMYQFQFGAPATHELFSDFEALMNSVEYPCAP